MAYPIGDLCEWSVLNDTIMGGSSSSACRLTAEGLLLEGNIVEQGGGFVSCRSPRFQPPLNLSAYRALRICVDGEGRTLKFALACSDGVMGLSELIPGGLRWVHSIRTNSSGTTVAEIQFQDLRPVIRAEPLRLPLRFEPSALTRLQLLHSRFDDQGDANPGFRAGSIRLLLRSIEAF